MQSVPPKKKGSRKLPVRSAIPPPITGPISDPTRVPVLIQPIA